MKTKLSSDQLSSRIVVVVHPRMLLGEAVQLMSRHKIRHLPVMEGSIVVGLLSSRDIFAALLKGGALAQI